MKLDEIIAQVRVERIYKHLLNVEGNRHAIDAFDHFNQVADYILSEFEKYGLKTNAQEFQVKGHKSVFRNIEGILGDAKNPELLIVSHYDTIENCPGADDNGSAIGIMLESARVLAETGWSGNARFISFALEELNPSRLVKERELALHHGMRDEKGRFTSWHTGKVLKQHWEIFIRLAMTGNPWAKAIAEATSQLKEQLTEKQLRYLSDLEKSYKDVDIYNWPGEVGIMGSSYWVDEAVRTKKQIIGVLCNETVGYTSKEENSQKYPKSVDPSLFKTYGTDEDLLIGDFLTIIGDKNSEKLANTFCAQSKLDSIALPYACLQGAFSYEQIAQIMGDLLRSDHAPFWRKGIPGLFLTDSANFRNPHYHTPSDTINTLDFDFITKVCKATIATTVNLASNS